MEIKYIAGDAYAFKAYIDAHYATGTVELRNVGGFNRWVVTEDGKEFVVRPEEARPEKENE